MRLFEKIKLINEVFADNELHSQTYKNACLDVLNKYEKQFSIHSVVKQSELLKDEDIPNIDDWIKDLGYTQITFSYVYKNGGTYKDREQLCKEYKKEFCL